MRIIHLVCCLAFITGFLLVTGAAQTPAPRSDASIKLEADTNKAKEKIAKIGKRGDITIKRRDGQQFCGTIVSVGEDSVIVREVDLKANVEINYQQIKSVEKGYTDTRTLSGNRVPPKRHKIGLIILGAGAAVLITIIVATLKNPNF